MQKADPTAKPWAITEAKVNEAVERLVAAAAPKQVIIFGSAARGDWSLANDLDLLLVKQEVRDRYAETVRLRRLLKDLVMPIDLVVTSEARFKQRSSIPGTLEYNALREGKVLHDAG